MEVINAKNVNDAYWKGMGMLRERGIRRESRVGPVLEMATPVTTVYHTPVQRVLFDPDRDANPFFHLMESLWMLAGRNDVAFPAGFAKQMLVYSDDNKILNGAYGYRWRKRWGFDQLARLVNLLHSYPDTRRAVLQMWDWSDLYDNQSKDLPCNTNIYFKIRGDKLQMTVCCRSNDIIWGAYGANAVHMSVLHEYIAACLGVPVGQYSQVSDSYHAYVGVFEKKTAMPLPDPYYVMNMPHYPLVQDPNSWMLDLETFMRDDYPLDRVSYDNPFFWEVAAKMRVAWRMHKTCCREAAIDEVSTIQAADWRIACLAWLERRYA